MRDGNIVMLSLRTLLFKIGRECRTPKANIFGGIEKSISQISGATLFHVSITVLQFYAYGGPQRPMSPDTVAAFVKKYGESARHVCTSIPERVHPHMLRHTRAMHLYQDGVPLAMVSEFLGHAQIETTKIYAHADTEMKRKAIQQAANKLNDTIPDVLWNTDDEEMMLKLRGKQQYK